MNLPPITQAFEQAARIACTKLGVSPDDMIVMPHPLIAGVTENVPRWSGERCAWANACKSAGRSRPFRPMPACRR